MKELETESAGHVAVAFGDIAAQSRDIFCQIMGNGYRAMATAGAAHGDDQLRPSLLPVLGQEEIQQWGETAEKFISLFRMKHIVPHRRVQPVEGLQLRDVVGVGQEADIQHQVGLRRQTVFEAEGEDVHVECAA